jgi:tRNA(Ile)-lysidine synthase
MAMAVRIARAAAAGQGRRVRGSTDHLAVYRYLVSRPVESAIQLHISETACDLEFSILNREQIDCLESAAPQIACFDLERLSFPLIVRNPRPGDRFWPLGMKGTQKISDFFINRKVSRSMRRQTALLESNGKIIWVVGYRTDHTTRIRPLTARALKVEFCLPKPQ